MGAVLYADGADIEELQAGFVARLRQAGFSVGGLLQRSGREANGRRRMDLIDIESGASLRISQNLGGDSRGCCVDVAGMADASAVLRRAMARRPDLLIINKFSGLEAEGGGLRAELLEALASDQPVLTGLAERHREAFAEATGGTADYLAAAPEFLWDWWVKTAARQGRDLPRH